MSVAVIMPTSSSRLTTGTASRRNCSIACATFVTALCSGQVKTLRCISSPTTACSAVCTPSIACLNSSFLEISPTILCSSNNGEMVNFELSHRRERLVESVLCGNPHDIGTHYVLCTQHNITSIEPHKSGYRMPWYFVFVHKNNADMFFLAGLAAAMTGR